MMREWPNESGSGKMSGGKHASVPAAASPTNHNQPELPANDGQIIRLCAPGLASWFDRASGAVRCRTHTLGVKQRECHGLST